MPTSAKTCQCKSKKQLFIIEKSTRKGILNNIFDSTSLELNTPSEQKPDSSNHVSERL